MRPISDPGSLPARRHDLLPLAQATSPTSYLLDRN
jgi:hypothetical protein